MIVTAGAILGAGLSAVMTIGPVSALISVVGELKLLFGQLRKQLVIHCIPRRRWILGDG